jgi:hypothetical protein
MVGLYRLHYFSKSALYPPPFWVHRGLAQARTRRAPQSRIPCVILEWFWISNVTAQGIGPDRWGCGTQLRTGSPGALSRGACGFAKPIVPG